MAKKKGTRYFVWIILILLFVGLLGFGTGGLSGNIRSIGTVGDKEISVASYQSALAEQIRAFEAQIGGRIGFAEAQSLGLVQGVQAQLVTTRALDNEASQLGISIGDARVREQVLRVPAFAGIDGEFDRESYADLLRRNGQSEAEFEAAIRDEISRTLLQGAVVGGIPTPIPYADALVQFVGETRDITRAFVTESDLTEPVPGPTDAQLAEYHAANPDNFTLPEAREITYVWLTPDMIQDELEVDEATLRALYDERSDHFIVPERRLVERLVYVDNDAAQTAMDRLTAGEVDFDGLVTERGLDLADVDLGDVAQNALGAAGVSVFAAEPGDVVGPLNSSIGPALFRVNAVLAAEETTFEEAADDLRAEVSADRAQRVIADGFEAINDLMAGGATLADLAERTDLELGEISWTADNSDGIAAYESFRAAAAEATEGAFPELLDLEDGGIFALQLDATTQPTVQPLDDVLLAARSGWIRAKTQELILARAQELADQIQPLTTFGSLGLNATADGGLTRRSFVEGTPPAFMLEVFNMDIGDTNVVDNGTGAIIVRLNRLAPPAADDPQTLAERESVAEIAVAGIAQDIFAAFAATVQNRTDIAIDQGVIRALHAQMQ